MPLASKMFHFLTTPVEPEPALKPRPPDPGQSAVQEHTDDSRPASRSAAADPSLSSSTPGPAKSARNYCFVPEPHARWFMMRVLGGSGMPLSRDLKLQYNALVEREACVTPFELSAARWRTRRARAKEKARSTSTCCWSC